MVENMKRKTECPNCGNTDESLIESNGCKPTDPNYTLLCTRRGAPENWAFAPEKPADDQLDRYGYVACGMQWSPAV